MLNQAIIFPGQGSQSVGMLSDLANQFPVIQATFDSVSDRLGYDLWKLVQEGPEATLNQTAQTQVAVLTADVALYRILQSQNKAEASMMAGHSLGEYAALVCSNAIDLADAAELVRIRGRVMQDTVPLGVGAMAAIVGLSDEDVINICKQISTQNDHVTPANFNAIGQVVIAGHISAVNKAIAAAEEKGARLAKLIPVSVPCHCPLLNQAAEQFAEALACTHFKVPVLPVISNVDLSIYTSVEQIKNLLKKQLYSPVRWVETIQLMQSKGIEAVVECGPGKVLSGLVKRIDKSLQTMHAGEQIVE